MPPEQRVVHRWYHECNYAQAMEGDLDTAHVSFLHKLLDGGDANFRRTSSTGSVLMHHGSPKLTIKETDYGFCYGARRNADEGYYWRITQCLLPGYSIIPSATTQYASGAWFPMDDHHSTGWRFVWNSAEPIPVEARARAGDPPTRPRARSCPWQIGTTIIRSIVRCSARSRSQASGISARRIPWPRRAWAHHESNQGAPRHLGPGDHHVSPSAAAARPRARAGSGAICHPGGELFHVRSLDVVAPSDQLDEVLKQHEDAVFHPVL